jgi:hypothetical protein
VAARLAALHPDESGVLGAPSDSAEHLREWNERHADGEENALVVKEGPAILTAVRLHLDDGVRSRAGRTVALTARS